MSDWRDEAACREQVTGPEDDLWFPVDAEGRDMSAHHEAFEQARSICGGCPVRQECLEHALTTGDHHGMRGGLTPEERANLARRRGRQASGGTTVKRDALVLELVRAGHDALAIAAQLAVSDTTVYRSLSRLRAAGDIGEDDALVSRANRGPYCGTQRGLKAHRLRYQKPCAECQHAKDARDAKAAS